MKIKITLVLIVLLASVLHVLAQPGDPATDPDVPITGIEILLTLGGALGIRKLIMDKRKKNS